MTIAAGACSCHRLLRAVSVKLLPLNGVHQDRVIDPADLDLGTGADSMEALSHTLGNLQSQQVGQALCGRHRLLLASKIFITNVPASTIFVSPSTWTQEDSCTGQHPEADAPLAYRAAAAERSSVDPLTVLASRRRPTPDIQLVAGRQ